MIGKALSIAFGLLLAASGSARADAVDRCVRDQMRERENGTLRHAAFFHPAWDHPTAGLLLTLDDLICWDRALDRGALLRRSSLEQAWTRAKLNDGSPARMWWGSYRLGWFVGDHHGHRYVGHLGGNAVWYGRYPDNGLTVIVLTNLEGSNPADLALRVADLYLPAQGSGAVRPARNGYCAGQQRVAAAGAASPAPATHSSAAGDWAGNVRFARRQYVITLAAREAAGRVTGLLRVPTYGAGLFARAALVRAAVSAGAVRFSSVTPLGELRFRGRLAGDRLAGDVSAGEYGGRFELVRVAPSVPERLAEYAGSYRMEPGLALLVTYGGIGGLKFQLFTEPGNSGLLFPTGGDTFLLPRADRPVTLSAGRVTFQRGGDGKIAGLVWHEAGRPDWTARRVAGPAQRRLTFTNGRVQLAGTLFIPPAPGPRPCVVAVHGSGPQSRDEWLDNAEQFTRRGIAVLTYDKRGAGESSGDWERASLPEFAGDALAAVRSLSGVPEIDPRRIGLIGGSQGGWIVPLAASMSREVAFIIAVSSSGVSPARQELYRTRNAWKAAGLSEADRHRLDAAWTRFYDLVISGREPARYRATWDGASTRATLRPYLPPPPDQIPPLYRCLGFGFDPLPVWRRVRCPALIVNGDADQLVPTAASVRLIERALRQGGHPRCTIRRFPGADHGLQVTRPDGSRGFAPGYFELLTSWVKRQSGRREALPLQ